MGTPVVEPASRPVAKVYKTSNRISSKTSIRVSGSTAVDPEVAVPVTGPAAVDYAIDSVESFNSEVEAVDPAA